MAMKICAVSGQEFVISQEDLDFYQQIDVPEPRLCPDERARRRMAFANQRNLYNRTCSGSAKSIISNYSPDKPFTIFDIEYFYSDCWDQFATGRDFDFNRPFFEQFKELMEVAPRPSAQRAPQFDENSDYTNYAGKNKNCYLIFDSDKNWDCYYSYSTNSSQNCVDCFRVDQCELCYECIDCTKCYDSSYLQNCDNCATSMFLKNCIGCSDCFGSVNLRNKQYYFLNERLSKEEYVKKINSIALESRANLQEFSKLFSEFSTQFPQKEMEGVQNENVLGNYLVQSKNCFCCFDSRKLWDCRYVQQAFDDAKICIDCTEIGDGVELCYETCYAGYSSHLLRFTSHALGKSSDLTYCYFTPHCTDCFACVGLRHAQYAILNKQYTKEEYDALVPQIIAHMKETGEWGEFFPIELSPFAYNESHAMEYFPLSREEVLARGWQWKDDIFESKEGVTPVSIPETIKETDQSIATQILTCEDCARQYKVIKKEYSFYKNKNIPLPSKCSNCRHLSRLDKRSRRKLYQFACKSCASSIATSYSPENPQPVFCDQCFLEATE